MSEIEFTDRYRALGIDYPDPDTMCKGPCEGVGVYPLYQSVYDTRSVVVVSDERPVTSAELAAWRAAHDGPHIAPCDGWHFVKCPDCGGTGKRTESQTEQVTQE